MKLKGGFVLSEIAGKTVAVPTEDDVDLNTMITLNETGAFLWERLQAETSVDALVDALLSEYDVDEASARRSVEAFVGKLKENGFIAE
ncbi:MAG: PqqD family protein [Clostridia bacterium]|nr:PqqD family protein [Clostridia bacterium]